jgi:hypothetical protein
MELLITAVETISTAGLECDRRPRVCEVATAPTALTVVISRQPDGIVVDGASRPVG